MTNKAGIKKQQVQSKEAPKKETGIFSYLRFGESYTSLILGIVVVIVATALLLSFVHNKNAGKVNSPVTQTMKNNVQLSQKAEQLDERHPSEIEDISPTNGPTKIIEPTTAPTVAPSSTVVAKKIVKKVAKATPTVTPTSIESEPTKAPQVKQQKQEKKGNDKHVWIVQKNESLWAIAEKKYNNGYKWVDIARANNLSNPSNIHVGDKLKLPKIEDSKQTKTIAKEKKDIKKNDQQKTSIGSAAIKGNSYQVIKGDSLWNIAERAYGDGDKWVDIAQANNLTNPSLIHSGNKLKIPHPKK